MGNFRASRRSRLTRTKLLMEAERRMTSMLVIMWHAQYPNFHLRRMSAGVGLCLSLHPDHVRVDGDHNADSQIYHGERDNHQAEPLHHTLRLTRSVSFLPAADTSWMSWWRQSARCWRIWSAQQWRSWQNSSSPRSSQSWWLAKLTPAAYQITNILDITLGISVTYHIDNSKFCFNPQHVCVGWTYFDRKRNSTLCLYRYTKVKELLKQDDFTYQNWN